MNYALSPKPVLGPCPCTNCGEPLYWARRTTRIDNQQVYNGLLWWRGWHGRVHRCGSDRRVVRNCRNSTRRRHSQIAHESLHHPRARARATWDNGRAGTSTNRIPFASTPHLLLVPAGAASSRSEGRD